MTISELEFKKETDTHRVYESTTVMGHEVRVEIAIDATDEVLVHIDGNHVFTLSQADYHQRAVLEVGLTFHDYLEEAMELTNIGR